MKISTIFASGLSTAMLLDHVTKQDAPQYTLCVELWCSLVCDCTNSHLAADLANAIRRSGLISCIESADQYAKAYLSAVERKEPLVNEEGLARLWQLIVDECTAADSYKPEHRAVSSTRWKYAFACEVILRFPKRYTVCDPPVEEATKKFLAVHHDDVRYSNNFERWPKQYVLELLRQCMREILIPSKRKFAKALRRYAATTGHFSSGAAFYPQFGTSRIPAAKYGYLVNDGYYLRRFSDLVVPGLPKFNTYHRYDVRVMAVPKDYETSRMIAPETPYLNYEASRARDLILNLIEMTGAIDEMPPEDQSLNRDRARMGSYEDGVHFTVRSVVDGNVHPVDVPMHHFCTIDLSHASDSISRSLFFAVLPYELHDIIRHSLADYMVVKTESGTVRKKMAMLATSGSVLTPILESTFFLAILHAACYLCGKPLIHHYVSAYNDDLICEKEEFQTVVELLQLCGLTVNEKKTFSEGPYRESCGGEYVCGMDVTGYYWPRHALRLYKCERSADPLTLQQLVAMQHKLYDFPTVRRAIEETVLSIFPRMTFSSVGSTNEDLWALWMSDYQTLTTKHVTFKNRYVHQYNRGNSELHWLTAMGTCAYDYIMYQKFLQDGPTYEDPLMELLGISVASDSREHSMCLPISEIGFTKPLVREYW